MVSGKNRKEPTLSNSDAKKTIEIGSDTLLPKETEAESSNLSISFEMPKVRPMWLLIIAVIFTGLAWFITDILIDEKSSSDDIPFIEADSGEIKYLPEDPGGVDVKNRDKYIYESLDRNTKESDIEQLLPPAEEPMEVFVDNDAQMKNIDDIEKNKPINNVSENNAIQKQKSLDSNKQALSTVNTSNNQSQNNIDQKETKVLKQKSLKQSLDTQSDKKISNQVNIEKDTKDTKLLLKSYRVQISASKNKDGLEKELLKLQSKYPNIFDDQETLISKIDRGEKGIWYRLRIGLFTERKIASDFCKKLGKSNIECFVTNN
tara:strand:- start:32797 stop:33750 length:954 start_codon:yes stop_codon:yes gene_type:complete